MAPPFPLFLVPIGLVAGCFAPAESRRPPASLSGGGTDESSDISGDSATAAPGASTDCQAALRGDASPGPVPSPGGVAPAPGDEARRAMTRFYRQQRIDARSLTASENLTAIAEAEARYRERHGQYLLFEEGTDAHWEALELELPAPVYHRYAARMEQGELLLVARGNLDTDPFEDRWWGGPANGGPAQLDSDALDAAMYPEALKAP